LIDDILELSSIESGRIAIQPEQILLAPLVSEIFTNLSKSTSDRKIKLTNNVATGAVVSADPVRLEQMLTNLIDNAVKFNRDNGEVAVSFSHAGDKRLISVEDSGEGISSEHMLRIFERFYRTDRARSQEIGGIGLGLAIVKHLARLHAGEISVASNPGKGTTFTIELPKKQ
jgi:two-component system phosphate regulon sensor histidine kinase PhoR